MSETELREERLALIRERDSRWNGGRPELRRTAENFYGLEELYFTACRDRRALLASIPAEPEQADEVAGLDERIYQIGLRAHRRRIAELQQAISDEYDARGQRSRTPSVPASPLPATTRAEGRRE